MWDMLNNVLAVIGVISLLITVLRIIWIFSGSTEWIDHVRIESHLKTDELDGVDGRYPQYYPDHPSRVANEYATQNLLIPQSTIIRKAVLKEVETVVSSGRKGERYKEKRKKLQTFSMITPQSPLCLVIERAECMPKYVLEWKTEYGGYTRYYFYENLRDGNNNCSGFEYHYGFWAKLRKILDLK